MRIKPPTFDGKTPWANFLLQFEAAARANGWTLAEKASALIVALRGDAIDVLQTIPLEVQDDYRLMVRKLELRYGHERLKDVYHVQLKNRVQKMGEDLRS